MNSSPLNDLARIRDVRESIRALKNNFGRMNLRILTVAACIALSFACKKEKDDGIKEEDKQKAAAFTALIQKHQYRLTAYYSKTPIDYDNTDEVVKAETDLWDYVSPWLPDDAYIFKPDNNVDVEQNELKIDTDSSDVIHVRWTVAADTRGVRFNFVGHEYQYLMYYLVSFDDNKLVMWANWNGNQVYSEFTAID